MLLKALGGTLVGMAVLWACMVCYMRSRIALAISLIRESASALLAMPSLCVFPALQTCVFVGFTALWMLFCVFLVTSGDITTTTDAITGISYQTVSYNTNTQRAIAFMLFVWGWSVGFIEAMGQVT